MYIAPFKTKLNGVLRNRRKRSRKSIKNSSLQSSLAIPAKIYAQSLLHSNSVLKSRCLQFDLLIFWGVAKKNFCTVDLPCYIAICGYLFMSFDFNF